MLVLVLAT